MKIGLVCPYNIFRGGGVQECVIALQHELSAAGHDARIITPRPNDVPDHDIAGLELVGTAKEVKSPFHTTAQVSVSFDPRALDTLLAHHNFDVLHFHEPWVPLLSWQLLAKAKCANVATFHAKLPETVMSKTIEKVITPYTKSILKSLGVLTAVSGAASQYVESLGDRQPVIVPNGIDLAKYKVSTKKRRDKHTILYVGRLEKRKGVKYLLKAFAQVAKHDENAQLIVAGAGSDKAKLEAYMQEKNIPRVTFLGYVDEQTKLNLLSEATIFCSPAIYGESFGIVLLEAMATGAVVVAGDNAGYRSVMQERGSISIVNPKDTTAFARRLRLLLNDESMRELWQSWAQNYVKQFDYRSVAKRYEDVYKKAIFAHNNKLD